MESWTETLPFRLHAAGAAVLCFTIPLLASEGPLPWYTTFLLFSLVFVPAAIQGIPHLNRHPGTNVSRNLPHLAVFLAAWTGVNVMGFNTEYPEISLRYYPDLHGLFPIFYAAGTVTLILMHRRNRTPPALQGWWTLLMMTSLPYTRPLDHHSLGMALPMIVLLHVLLIIPGGSVASPARQPLILISGAAVIVFFVRTVTVLDGAFTDVVPDILFFGSAGLMVGVTMLLFRCCGAQLIRIFYRYLRVHGGILVVLAGAWLVHSVITIGPAALLKYRLWISLIHPNALCVYCGATLFLMGSPGRPPGFNAVSKTIGGALLVMMILTQSRGAVIAAVLTILIAAVLHSRDASPRLRTLPVRIAAACAGLILVLLTWRVRYRLFTAGMIRDRLALWEPALRGLADGMVHSPHRTFTGFGAKTLLAEFVPPDSTHTAFLSLWMQWDRLGRHFHNLFIETAWVWGWPGLLICAGFIGLAFRACTGKHSMKGTGTGFRNALIFLLLAGIADCPYYYPALMIMLSVVIALPAGTALPGHAPQPPASGRNRSVLRRRVFLTGIVILVEWGGIAPLMATRAMELIGNAGIGITPAFAEACLWRAGAAHPPSVQARRELARITAETGRCDDARAILTSPVSGSLDLVRHRAWLERDPEHRSRLLESVLARDPSGITGPNALSELALSLQENEPAAGFRCFQDALVMEDDLVASLIRFGT
ncbi:MAG TPA: hypothetical protein PLV45_12995, partial [bacterium]|nr:hypothetical protein [bacterium]